MLRSIFWWYISISSSSYFSIRVFHNVLNGTEAANKIERQALMGEDMNIQFLCSV